jgi:hypothetical protein
MMQDRPVGQQAQIPGTTEDAPSTPGWVEGSVEEIFASLPPHPATTRLRDAYLDCLAGARAPNDLDASHDRCRAALLQALQQTLDPGTATLAALERRLEALEAEITDRV